MKTEKLKKGYFGSRQVYEVVRLLNEWNEKKWDRREKELLCKIWYLFENECLIVSKSKRTLKNRIIKEMVIY